MHEIAEKVKHIFETEKGRPKKVTDPQEVPSTYDAITEEWLTKILCRDTPGAKGQSRVL